MSRPLALSVNQLNCLLRPLWCKRFKLSDLVLVSSKTNL